MRLSLEAILGSAVEIDGVSRNAVALSVEDVVTGLERKNNGIGAVR